MGNTLIWRGAWGAASAVLVGALFWDRQPIELLWVGLLGFAGGAVYSLLRSIWKRRFDNRERRQ